MKRSKILIVSFLVAPVALLSGISPTGAKPACEVARAWVEAHADDLPTTLEELAQLPLSTRIAVFRTLPYERRAALWHEQLNRFASSRDLTRAQRDVVNAALKMVTADMYRRRVEGMTDSERHSHENEHSEFAKRARAAFDRETLRVFGELGWIVRPVDKQRGVMRLVPAIWTSGDAASCECSVAEDFCALDCKEGLNNCEVTPDGCGWFNCEPCDGSCI